MNPKKFFFNILRKIRFLLLSTLDFLTPKKSNCILFGSRAGNQYGDNSRFLFEWVRENMPNLNAYYLTADKKILNSEDKDKSIISYHSFAALKKLLRAKKVFITHGFADMPYKSLCKKRHIIYFLGHGLSFKRTDLAAKEIDSKKARKFKRTTQKLFAYCSSGVERLAIHAYYGIPFDRIRITGTPRNEVLWNNMKNKKNIQSNLENLFSFQNKSKKTILYAPTYLPEQKNDFFSFEDFNMEQLKAFLEKNNLYLFLRMHRNDLLRYGKMAEDPSNNRIRILDFDLVADVNTILYEFDILITDFSSIFLDYLIVDKPIIFITSILEEYQKQTGFYFDYNSVTPGVKVKNFSEFLDSLNECLDKPEKWQEKRIVIANLFHEYQKGESCRKIMEYSMKD
ncbi:MAG TPA: CDP-glycerol glycerophosphotransferase family protein [Candidatus Bathyarchaeia archaeon]|nr:CDP-glycerol glycerophosphotransferase family protein [Candidatus Bathyarchaeia archaeon]